MGKPGKSRIQMDHILALTRVCDRGGPLAVTPDVADVLIDLGWCVRVGLAVGADDRTELVDVTERGRIVRGRSLAGRPKPASDEALQDTTPVVPWQTEAQHRPAHLFRRAVDTFGLDDDED